ncbi:MAG: DUF3006 domain-containing protein [Caldicoprobacter sp.]|uniref:DUF3006 domain-containing protein n=1 Tax=Caldicoprobacter sp. TaxID=2004500 RepID=UPI001D99CE86|nr:DUF3006 domain-containing protein [Clostridia bacterium]
MKKVIIDRFEGDFAVCEDEDRKMINIEKSRLPEDAKEGTVLIIMGDKEDDIKVDYAETEARKSRIKRMMDSLFN